MTTTTTKFFPTPARPVAPVSLDYTLTSTEKNFYAVASDWPSNVAVDPNIQYPTSSLQMLPPPPASSSPSSQPILQSHHLLPPLSQRQQRPHRFTDNELPSRGAFAPYVADGGVEPRNARKRSFSSHFQGDASWEMDRTSYETLYNISSDIRQAVSAFPIANAANGPNGSADVSLATTTILPSIQELGHLIDRAGLMVMVFEKAQNKGVDRKLDNQLSSFRYAEKPKMKYKRKNAQGQLHCHSCKSTETPEWRKGPLGPRTLCNACGLIWAKLSRKKAKDQQQGSMSADQRSIPLDGSNLSLRDHEPSSDRSSPSTSSSLSGPASVMVSGSSSNPIGAKSVSGSSPSSISAVEGSFRHQPRRFVDQYRVQPGPSGRDGFLGLAPVTAEDSYDDDSYEEDGDEEEGDEGEGEEGEGDEGEGDEGEGDEGEGDEGEGDEIEEDEEDDESGTSAADENEIDAGGMMARKGKAKAKDDDGGNKLAVSFLLS